MVEVSLVWLEGCVVTVCLVWCDGRVVTVSLVWLEGCVVTVSLVWLEGWVVTVRGSVWAPQGHNRDHDQIHYHQKDHLSLHGACVFRRGVW